MITAMPWMTEMIRMWEVILRVPPLFMIDSLLNYSFFSYFQFLQFDTPTTWTQNIEWLLLFSLCLSVALVIFLLGTRQLLTVYSRILSVIAVLVAYFMNVEFTRTATRSVVGSEFPNPKNRTIESIPPETIEHGLQTSIRYLIGQLAAAFIFCKSWQFHRDHPPDSKKYVCSVFLSFVFPILVTQVMQVIYPSSETLILWSQVVGLILPLMILSTDVINTVSLFYFNFRHSYNLIKLTISAIGIQGFLENHWVRLQIPKVLRLFFTSRFIFQVGYLYWTSAYRTIPNTLNVNYVNADILNNISYQVVVRSCDNIVALLGLTSIVSFCAHYIGIFMAFCIGTSEEDDKNMGTVSAILFFILALQTGLTGLEPEKRLARLCKNLYLLGTAITHFVHSMVHPLLMSLSASRNMHIKRHMRALTMCAFLITFPSCLLVYLWSIHKVNTWLMAVTAFSLEVIIKVIVSLMVYFLFMLDAYRDKFWESLDDYVYYIQSTGNTIEFLFGIFLFCNGGWILLFESGGTIRAIMMCIHAYFNIWVQAKEGWKVFMKRKTAVDKINSLPLASQEQLRTLNDVCAICYQDLQNARITSCNHYFHGVCLRKWLYVQDNCPMCYKVIYNSNDVNSSSVDGDDANQNNINNGLIQPMPVQPDHQD
ncbi:protein TRC8 homolog [Ylistrum balloti]|uniref:protein TRC8 homolog n=1 Tax=Ylistrum balloti TaxID=509963 RepID=UPI002905E23F|nr:protein TRC8 homolog [Ylistrum balloti]